MRHIIIADHVAQRGLQEDEYSAIFRQGDLDGACGIYSLMMCLNLCNIDEAQQELLQDFEEVNKQTRFGKMVKEVEKLRGLISSGIELQELQKILQSGFRTKLECEAMEESGKKVLAFTLNHLWQGHPVLLGVKWSGVSHWVVACGMEFVTPTCDTFPTPKNKPERIFLLDPGSAKTETSIWNGYITLEAGAGRYPYTYVQEGQHCCATSISFDEAMAIWPK